MKNNFAHNVRELRLQKGLLQREFAEKLKTTQRKVSYWENGHIEPDLDTLIEIADYFVVSVDELIREE